MNRHTGYYIKQIANRLEAGWNAALKNLDVTGTQLCTLEYLYHNPEKNQVSDISEFFGVKHTSTLHVLRLLEKKNCIYREEADNGRRPVGLTQHGIELVKMNESGAAKMDEIMFSGFSNGERQTFLCLLKRVNDNLENGGTIHAE
ncbi:MAG: MarR family transcriptional regulator [Eubacteriales bacterium]|nr:MarR family transcriptional regulator [Eubacteriales bacterium]